MNYRKYRTIYLAITILIVVLAVGTNYSQTIADLHVQFGSPKLSNIKNGRLTSERYHVRSNIVMTVTYTRKGEICEVKLDPEISTTPAVPVITSPPNGDYMSTAEATSVINELVPPGMRGKSIVAFGINGGDPLMKLHHPGCWGGTIYDFANVVVSTSSWCNGGTFKVIIQWKDARCKRKEILVTRN